MEDRRHVPQRLDLQVGDRLAGNVGDGHPEQQRVDVVPDDHVALELGGVLGVVGVQVQRVVVHREQAEQMVVVLGDRLSRPVPVDRADLELLVVPAKLHVFPQLRGMSGSVCARGSRPTPSDLCERSIARASSRPRAPLPCGLRSGGRRAVPAGTAQHGACIYAHMFLYRNYLAVKAAESIPDRILWLATRPTGKIHQAGRPAWSGLCRWGGTSPPPLHPTTPGREISRPTSATDGEATPTTRRPEGTSWFCVPDPGNIGKESGYDHRKGRVKSALRVKIPQTTVGGISVPPRAAQTA
ncbi:hypothetical protein FMEAI12_3240003 [Parafrankia sp. Ea1.12]|nr:hypothetical protein FMEAI12_3240003 [Parafrankia sp. Ea1.12]